MVGHDVERWTTLNKDSKIFVAGAETLIGAAILRQLDRRGYRCVLPSLPDEKLVDVAQVNDFFAEHAPEYVFLTAGKAGGIQANQKYPAELMLNNLLIPCHVIDSAFRHKTKKLLYLASSCTYPRLAPQPTKEDALLSGPLEPTNEAYALAKLAGIKLCQAYRRQYGVDFVAGIPTNAFGPGDHFNPLDSHVISSLILKIHEGRRLNSSAVEVWGTGAPIREFVFVDDLADACLFIMDHFTGDEPINLGGGSAVSIKELAFLIKSIVSYQGELRFDVTKPDGAPIKTLDCSKLYALGWRPTTSLESALRWTYEWFVQQRANQSRI